MKLIVIISLFLYIGCSPSKNIAVPQDISPPDTKGILTFNQLTNAADFAILDSNPSLAVELYRQAFAKNEVGYIMPYYNAYLAAKEIGDCDMSYFAAKQLLGYGAWITHFQSNSCLVDNDFLWTELEDVYMTSVASKDYSTQFRSLSFAISLRNNSKSAKLFSLLRTKAGKDTIQRLMKKDSLDKMDFSQIPAPYPEEAGIDSLATVFIDLVKKYGFPSERSIGAEWTEAGVEFLHYSSFSLIYERNKQVRTIFDDAFEDGLISAGEYAAVSLAKPFFFNPIFRMADSKKRYVFEFSESERLEINAIRKSIGLPSIEKQIEVRSKIQIVPDTTYFFSWLGDLHYFIDQPPDHAYQLWDE